MSHYVMVPNNGMLPMHVTLWHGNNACHTIYGMVPMVTLYGMVPMVTLYGMVLIHVTL